MTLNQRNRFLAIAAVLGLLVVLSAWAMSLTPEDRKRLLSEGGPIEIGTAILYMLGVGFVLVRGGLAYAKSCWIPLAFYALLGFRELDVDKRFTTMGLFKTEFFVSSRVPLIEKLIGIVIIAALIWMLAALFKRHVAGYGVPFRKWLARFPELAVSIFVLLMGSGLDGIGRKLGAIGIHLSSAQSRAAGSLEEVFELGIPLFLALAFNANLAHRSKGADELPEIESPPLQ